MKKLILVLLVLEGLSNTWVAGQGSVVFANVTSTAGWAPSKAGCSLRQTRPNTHSDQQVFQHRSTFPS